MRAVISGAELWALCRSGAELRVLGVFSSAVYLCGTEGVAAMLHDSRHGSLSFGMAVEGLEGRGRELGLTPGEAVRLSEDRLSAPASGFALELEYRAARKRRIQLRNKDIAALAESVCAALESDGRASLLVYCGAPPAAECIDDPFARAGCEGALRLSEAMAGDDAALAGAALERLLGLGRGLTPSFDDFLCGACYTLNRLRAASPFTAGLNGALLRLAPVRTNEYSAAYLRAAAAGELSALDDVLDSGPGAERDRAIAAVLELGSSSGADMLSGLLFALKRLR